MAVENELVLCVPAVSRLQMSGEQRKKEYLAKAREAEEHAQRTPDRHEKESWLRIAQSYRELAKGQ